MGGFVLGSDYLGHRKHKTASLVLRDGISEHGKNKMGGFVLGRKIASYFFYLCGMKTLLKILTIFIAIGAIGGSVMRERLVCNGVNEIYAEARAEEREIFEKKIYAFVARKKLLP